MVQAIAPKYSALTANAAIDLGTAPVELRSGAIKVAGQGRARLELRGKELVIVEVDSDFDGYQIGHKSDLHMKFGPLGRFVPVMLVESQTSNTGAKLSLIVNGAAFTQMRDGRIRLSSAIVHVLNFPEFYCLGGTKTDLWLSNRRLGHVVLQNADWTIELQALPSTNRIIGQLKA